VEFFSAVDDVDAFLLPAQALARGVINKAVSTLFLKAFDGCCIIGYLHNALYANTIEGFCAGIYEQRFAYGLHYTFSYRSGIVCPNTKTEQRAFDAV
jgi:hypothetical protein